MTKEAKAFVKAMGVPEKQYRSECRRLRKATLLESATRLDNFGRIFVERALARKRKSAIERDIYLLNKLGTEVLHLPPTEEIDVVFKKISSFVDLTKIRTMLEERECLSRTIEAHTKNLEPIEKL